MRVRGNWLNGELTSQTSLQLIGRYFVTHEFIWSHHCYSSCCCFVRRVFFLLALIPNGSLSSLLFVDSKRFQPELNVVCVAQLNFVLRSKIFVRYDGQLRASHSIHECVPTYTSYQDLMWALTVESSLLSFLDVDLPGFVPPGLTSEEPRHQGPRIFQAGSLELVWDGLGDIVFQGRAMHIPIDALIKNELNP